MRWHCRIRDKRELLDDPRVEESIRVRALREVECANAYFGGHRVLRQELRNALCGWQRRTASVLDVGTGSGGIAGLVRAEGRQRGVTVTTIGIDLHAGPARMARSRGILAVRGDALALPFADGSVDVAICSLLLHHFEDEDAITVMRELVRVARHRVIVCDLRRSRVAAAGFWLASFAIGFHPVTRHDGVLSILRAFTRSELADLVRLASGRPSVVRSCLGFRLVTSYAPGSPVRGESLPRDAGHASRARPIDTLPERDANPSVSLLARREG